MADDQHRTRRGGVETSIRTAAIWRSVLDAATQRAQQVGRPLRVVDLGGGTGGLAVPLAEHGHEVTVVDPSPDALASLMRRAREVEVDERITALQGDAATLTQVVPAAGADLVCCHGVLEVLDDDADVTAALDSLAQALAPGGTLSLVVAQRLAVVLGRALAGRFDQARAALSSDDGRWGSADPLPRRFDADQVRALARAAGLEIVAEHGVRLFADLVPAAMLDTDADAESLMELEDAIAAHPTYAFLGNLAGAVHILARRPQS